MWIEQASFLVRRIDGQSAAVKVTTLYRPEVNQAIPAKDLEFGAPQVP